MTSLRPIGLAAVAAAAALAATAIVVSRHPAPPPDATAHPPPPPVSVPVVSGRVVDGAANPVASATVGCAQSLDATTRTDARGQFSLRIPRGEPTVVFAYAPGTATHRIRNVAPGTTGLEFVLVPESRVTGLVELADGTATTLVSLCESNREPRLCVARDVVRPSKPRFDLRGLSQGRYELAIERNGQRLSRRTVELREGETLVLGRLVLAPRVRGASID